MKNIEFERKKIKIIKDSKKPGFDKAIIMKDYRISRPKVINVLKNQFETLKAVDSDIIQGVPTRSERN